MLVGVKLPRAISITVLLGAILIAIVGSVTVLQSPVAPPPATAEQQRASFRRAIDAIPPRQATTDDFLALTMSEGASEFAAIRSSWQPSYLPMMIETMRLRGWDRGDVVSDAIVELLQEQTGQDFGRDFGAWWRYVWSSEPVVTDDYASFKSAIYGRLDGAFRGYFDPERTSRIRLDEVVWGGVGQDGIPPLRQPTMVDAKRAAYLDDSNVVFGLEINGDARAYPKRILAWHEMFVDKVGGVDVAGVYCTLCGTVILYETTVDGVAHALGTSGFLYRSNKLMYDKATQSLWNTIWGEPVIGPLADAEPPIRLPRRAVVTTTWGEWKRRHPGTTVLSLETGYERNYDEGEAYRDYFATDELMFTVPDLDTRLPNKHEILGIVLPDGSDPAAFDTEFLRTNPIHHDRMGDARIVILTDRSGANRAYEIGELTVERYDGDATAQDAAGRTWTVTEDGLRAADGAVLDRVAAQRAFWFGWRAAFEQTRLVR